MSIDKLINYVYFQEVRLRSTAGFALFLFPNGCSCYYLLEVPDTIK